MYTLGNCGAGKTTHRGAGTRLYHPVMDTLRRMQAASRSSRGDAAGLAATGVLLIIAWLWSFHSWYFLSGGMVAAAAGTAGLTLSLRRGPVWHQQDVLIRRLWTAVKQIPSRHVLVDPETGQRLTVERERGSLTLAVSDRSASTTEPVVTRILVGRFNAPGHPPLYKHYTAAGDDPPARWPWRQRAMLDLFQNQVRGLEIDPTELADVLEQLARSSLHWVTPD
jgi:hypothetical protein